MKTELHGKTALVTGGAKGYGLGITTALRARGVRVWITGRDQAALDAAAAATGARGLQADVTSPTDWDRVFDTILGEAGRLDILVNNAGGGGRIGHLHEVSDEEIEATVALNLTSAAFGCRRAARVMTAQKSGVIINVSSVCQNQAWPGWAVYSAAKAGMAQLSNTLHTELREHGVRVTNLVPSWGATGFLDAAGLPAFSPEIGALCIQPSDIGELVAAICELPAHLTLLDATLLPLVQKIEPL